MQCTHGHKLHKPNHVDKQWISGTAASKFNLFEDQTRLSGVLALYNGDQKEVSELKHACVECQTLTLKTQTARAGTKQFVFISPPSDSKNSETHFELHPLKMRDLFTLLPCGTNSCL